VRTRTYAAILIVSSIVGQLYGWRAVHRFSLDPVFHGEVLRSPWYMHVVASPLWGLGVPVATAGLALWLGSSARPRAAAWIALAVVAFACECVMLILGEVI
jgi:hypothetical protein